MKTKTKKCISQSAISFFLASALISFTLLGFTHCNSGDHPAIIVNGEKLGEKELSKEFPEHFQKIKNDYNKAIMSGLRELALRRMFELEAKSKNMSAREYSKKIQDSVPTPTPAEVEKTYADLRKTGRVGKMSFAEARSRIIAMLSSQRRRAHFAEEVSRLKKKYAYKSLTKIARTKIDTAGEPTRGSANAKVVIVEFSDFECPFCQKAQKTTKQVREAYGNKVRFVFKDFPLEFHRNAMGAHVAANCMNKQNAVKFWKFFDIIFAETRPPNTLGAGGLRAAAKKVGADMGAYSACLKDPAMVQEIRDDMKQGQSAGINGTPAFFINGRFLNGAVPFSEFKEIIDEELSIVGTPE